MCNTFNALYAFIIIIIIIYFAQDTINHTACQYMSRTDKAIMFLQLPYRNKEQIKTNDIL